MQSFSNDSSDCESEQMQSSSYYKELINNHSTRQKQKLTHRNHSVSSVFDINNKKRNKKQSRKFDQRQRSRSQEKYSSYRNSSNVYSERIDRDKERDDVIFEIKNIKTNLIEFLNSSEDNNNNFIDTIQDLLRRLQQLNIDVYVLNQTKIGKVLNQIIVFCKNRRDNTLSQDLRDFNAKYDKIQSWSQQLVCKLKFLTLKNLFQDQKANHNQMTHADRRYNNNNNNQIVQRSSNFIQQRGGQFTSRVSQTGEGFMNNRFQTFQTNYQIPKPYPLFGIQSSKIGMNNRLPPNYDFRANCQSASSTHPHPNPQSLTDRPYKRPETPINSRNARNFISNQNQVLGRKQMSAIDQPMLNSAFQIISSQSNGSSQIESKMNSYICQSKYIDDQNANQRQSNRPDGAPQMQLERVSLERQILSKKAVFPPI